MNTNSAFARDQQIALDQAADELAKLQKELADRREQAERQWAEREKSVAAREQDLVMRRAGAIRRAAAWQVLPRTCRRPSIRRRSGRASAFSSSTRPAQELLRRHLEGEKNVLAARIAGLEHTVAEQDQQITRLEQRGKKRPTHRSKKSPFEPLKDRPAQSNWPIFNNCWLIRLARLPRRAGAAEACPRLL